MILYRIIQQRYVLLTIYVVVLVTDNDLYNNDFSVMSLVRFDLTCIWYHHCIWKDCPHCVIGALFIWMLQLLFLSLSLPSVIAKMCKFFGCLIVDDDSSFSSFFFISSFSFVLCKFYCYYLRTLLLVPISCMCSPLEKNVADYTVCTGWYVLSS